MRKSFFSILLTFFLSMTTSHALAYDIAVPNADGVTIYYNFINDETELSVTNGESGVLYTGNVVIPDEVTIDNKWKVTSIGYSAFKNCRGLTSVTIPNSVTSIESSSFQYCI